jgi:hypothetical protein
MTGARTTGKHTFPKTGRLVVMMSKLQTVLEKLKNGGGKDIYGMRAVRVTWTEIEQEVADRWEGTPAWLKRTVGWEDIYAPEWFKQREDWKKGLAAGRVGVLGNWWNPYCVDEALISLEPYWDYEIAKVDGERWSAADVSYDQRSDDGRRAMPIVDEDGAFVGYVYLKDALEYVASGQYWFEFAPEDMQGDEGESEAGK